MKKIIVLLLIIFSFKFVLANQVVSSEQKCINLVNNVFLGVKDIDNVKLLQTFLKNKGYLNSNIDGLFGPKTLQAVKNLQKENGLKIDGRVGPLTRLIIKNISCSENSNEISNTTNNSQTNTESVSNIGNIDASNTNTNTTPIPQTTETDEILTVSGVSSLRVKTEGSTTITNNSVLARGNITLGARSGTERWFELTTNPSVYKKSETTLTSKVQQRSNGRFEDWFTGLKPGTTYYFRACAGNVSLGQKSCGDTASVILLSN